MGYIWGVLSVEIETCLQMLTSLRELRNEEVNGKEEVTMQLKREAKEAITAQALHDLEEIAHHSDSFLFYQDVIKKENKNATAAKLEGFIAMKTRPLRNSMFHNETNNSG